MDTSKPSDLIRRDFLKKAAYVAPAVLTLQAVPALAQVASGVTNDIDRDVGPASPEGFIAPEKQVIDQNPAAGNANAAGGWWGRWRRRFQAAQRDGRSTRRWRQQD